MTNVTPIQPFDHSQAFLDPNAQPSATPAYYKKKLDDKVAQIKGQLNNGNCLATLTATTNLLISRRVFFSGEESFGADAAIELLQAIFCSLEHNNFLEDFHTPVEIQTLREVYSNTKQLARCIQRYVMVDNKPVGRPTQEDLIRGQIAFDRAFDRRGGFDSHIQDIAEEVFATFDKNHPNDAGFPLSSALRLAATHTLKSEQNLQTIQKHAIGKYLAKHGVECDAEGLTAYANLQSFLAPPSPIVGEEENAGYRDSLGLDKQAYDLLLDSLSIVLPTEIADPTRWFRAQTRPIIRDSVGNWIWLDPIGFKHDSIRWAREWCRARGSGAFDAFNRTVQRTAERLTRERLERVFNPKHCLANAKYTIEGEQGESDLIISIPGGVITVEVKAGTFSDAARNGYRPRIDKHYKRLVQEAIDQNSRTARSIKTGVSFTDAAGTIRTTPKINRSAIYPIVILFDRIDGFQEFAPLIRKDATDTPNWVINISDLYLLSEHLCSPEEFTAYMLHRFHSFEDEIIAPSEEDCFALWCIDRTGHTLEAKGSGGRTLKFVDRSPEWLQQAYSAPVELDSTRTMPSNTPCQTNSSGIPREAIAALAIVGEHQPKKWLTLVDACGQISPKTWAYLKNPESSAPRPEGVELTRTGYIMPGGVCVKPAEGRPWKVGKAKKK